MEISSGPVFLLTGAGFSKNFGGFLGSQMWAEIFNEPRIQTDPDLRAMLINDYDYESVYSRVIDSTLSDEKKELMREVMLQAYRQLDDILKNWTFNDGSPYPVNPYLLIELIQRVQSAATHPAKSFLFTLNQDLFMERRWNWRSPGVPPFAKAQNDFGSQAFNAMDFVTLPTGDGEALVKKGLTDHHGIHYIKLHGSYGWKASDGSDQLVVGTTKESLIQKEPILQSYFDLFQSVIKEDKKKVLIIGYSFRDKHINNVLIDGVQNHGLEIYILSPQAPEDLYAQINNGHNYAKPIFDVGLRGYFQNTLLEVFPRNQDRTPHYEKILKALGI